MEPVLQGKIRLPNGRFSPGHSGNPNGGPRRECSITALLREQLKRKCPGDKQGRTWREVLTLSLLTGALKNPALMKEVLDRVDGRPPLALAGEGGGPILIKVVYEQAAPQAG